MTGLTLEEKYLYLPSSSSTAVNTPAATDDKPFVFPTSELSRATSKISTKSADGKEKAKDELESGQQTPVENYLPALEYVPPQKVILSKSKRILLGAVMMSTTFVASATLSSSLLCIPNSAKDLGITELQAQWISSAYSLANGCGLLVSGRLADLYGRKWLYLLGMAAFLILNVISGVVRNYIGICVLRAFAGLAVSVALPAAFGIIGVTFDSEPGRTIAFAALALGYPVGSGPGMIIAGVISSISARAWQYVFFILAGLSLFPVVGGVFSIPPEPSKKDNGNRRVDWMGAFLITAGLSLFSFALTQSGLVEKGWRTPCKSSHILIMRLVSNILSDIPVVLVISILLIVLYGFWEHFVEKKTSIPPLSRLVIFSRRQWKVTAILVVSFFAYVPIAGWMYLTTIWFQNYKQESALMNAVHILPAPVVGVIACVLVPLLAPKIRAPYLLMFGGFSTAAANWLLAIRPEGEVYWAHEFLSCVFNPFGADFTVGIGSVLISNLVSEDEQSLAGALFQTALQIASTVGVCICSLMQTEITAQSGSLLTGLRDTFWMSAAFSWTSAIIAFITLRKVGLAKDVGKEE
ncbi:efflux protein [Cryptococcus deuterogattii 99/473]|uniref:Efflux protein n=1 Tax=Cryptococcus deuterogattii Ram5 TaxID=1296110 RepID=A0A0D0UXT5_9TREE|nr:efflux protein [Cryptococcus deuterogattii MMRL2647]KIR37560.1 efflux protein [Cryptococcus deuterogattii Ram5]KIR96187.1 efflux protein [Cryptococcus deuterogattii 2001/935-1]KIY54913.1 efflux protein [Cryptococcus deuterogattii 99/473]